VKLPTWTGSIRFRITLLYSAVLFAIAALLVGALYAGLGWKLRQEPLSDRVAVNQFFRAPDGTIYRLEGFVIDEARAFERTVNENTLSQLRDFSFIALAILFGLSLLVGWIVSGRVLSPIGHITDVARQIQATDLSRRIRLTGPKDELTDLAATFDNMLDRIEEAFSSQRRFVADASHELRNPLAVIRTNLDVALADPNANTAELRRAAEVARSAGDRMSRMVEDLLMLARLEARVETRSDFQLGDVIDEVAEEFRAAASEGDIAFGIKASARSIVNGDRDAIKRALANLLENAIRLSPGTRIEIDSGAADGWTWVAVADQGPGVEPADLEHIFDRFYRADQARARSDGGTGLGLAIVRRIVEVHRGVIRVGSRPGVGTTFLIWLPVSGSYGTEPPAGDPVLLTS
jgi:signal transduction histidine kinase